MLKKLLILSLLVFCSSAYGSRNKTVAELLNEIDQKGANKALAKKQKALIPKLKAIKAVRPKNISKVKPIRTRKILKGDRETLQLESVIDESIDELFKLTQKYSKSPNRGELWLRLGELYVEKAKLIEIRTYDEYDKQLNLFYDKKRKTKPRLNLSLSKDFNKKAIRLYEWFVRDFPKDRKVPQALFFLGYNYFQIGDTKRGARYFEELNKKFPKSKFVTESNFTLGEYYFERERWKDALRAYTKVIRDGDAKLNSFALYKSAWCQYRLGDINSGLGSLERVIKIGRRSQEKKIKLVSEAQRDMVFFYANVGSYKRAKAYFSRYIDDKDLPGALERLGFMYFDSGKRRSGRFIFKNLINSNPRHEKAIDYQFQITDAYKTGGSKKVYLSELANFIENYGPNSAWAKANPGQISKSQALREKYLHTHALQNHQTYLKNRSQTAMKMAEAGYKLYLQHFPQGSNLDEVYFFYGELLFDQDKFKAAARAYDWVVKNAPKSQYYTKALNNALVALEKNLPSEEEIRKIVGDSVDRFEQPDEVKLFISIADDYKDRFQSRERKAEIQFRIGRFYYLYNHFPEAEVNFKAIVNQYPGTKYADFSTNLILDIYNLQKDYAGLTSVGEELLQNPNLSSSPALKEVKSVLEKAAFKTAQDLEAKKDFLGSAKAYHSFAQKYPKSALSLPAQYNAAVNYERANQVLPALVFYTLVAKEKSKKYSEEINTSYISQASLLEKIGRYEEAAKIYEDFANKNPKDKQRADYYYNAATLWDAINNDARAVKTYERYYRLTKSKDKAEVFFNIAKIYEDNNKNNFATQYYKRFIGEYRGDKSRITRAKHDLAKLYEKMQEDGKARYWYRDLIKNHSRDKGKSVRFVAEAKLQMAIYNYNRYVSIKFPNDPNKQAAVLNQKLKLLNDLNTEFSNVIKLNSGPQIISSLTYIGKAYEHFADAVENAPKPKGLTKEELQEYNAGLEQVTKPKRDTAIQFYKESIKKSNDLNLFDESTQIAYNALSRYEPEKYPYGLDFVIESPSVEVKQL